MNKLKTINHKDPNFEIKFVTGFYDHPLTGIATYNGEMVFFERRYLNKFVDIFSLTLLEKITYKIRHKAFELCVGTHQTYDKGKKSEFFYWRSPKWIHVILFNWYYHKFNFSKWRTK